MRRNGVGAAAVVAVVLSSGIASGQCETAGECFCDQQGMVGVAQLIRGVNILLGQSECPSSPNSPCGCCACDLGGGDVECGTGDVDCLECMSVGGVPASSCSICGSQCSSAETLCMDNPQHCQMGLRAPCACCACDFGGGDVECGAGDTDCAECISLGGALAADCSICGSECNARLTLCANNPQDCKMSTGSVAQDLIPGSSIPHYSKVSPATRSREGAYNR
jgi:hypothetical protein